MKVDFLSDINKELFSPLEYPRIDGLLLKILWWHFAVLTAGVLAIYLFEPARYIQSPLSYRELALSETLSVIAIGLFTSLMMTLLRNRLTNHYHYRLLMTAALIMYSYLIVFITGGSIEAHFHFFMVLALLCVYYDWRLGWLATVLTALHHGILNYVAPNWVYFYGRNDWSIIAHAVPVIVTVLFTTWICENGRRTVEQVVISSGEIRASSAKISEFSKTLEKKVDEKTVELQEKMGELEKFNKIAIGRELQMAEMKKKMTEIEGREKSRLNA